jgi:hypothetical protein
MSKLANCLMQIPRAILRYAVEWVRGYLVYLTIFSLVAAAWAAAWSRAGEAGHRRLMMPAFTRAELAESHADKGEEGAVVELDDREVGE